MTTIFGTRKNIDSERLQPLGELGTVLNDKHNIDFTVTNLEPGRMYFFRVRAYKKVKVDNKMKTLRSEWSGTVKKRLR